MSSLTEQASLRILFISTCDTHGRYLIRSIAERFNVCGVIRPTASPAPGKKTNWKQKIRTPLRIADILINRAFTMYRDRRSETRAVGALTGNELSSLSCKVVSIPAWSINLPSSVEQISAFKPDVILVCGAPILAPDIYEIPRMACMNLHYGIAPRYRGEHTLFWPLQTDDYANIGITIHNISSGVDTGAPFVRAYPALDQGDDEDTIAVKCVRMAAPLLQEILGSMQRDGHPPELTAPKPEAGGMLIRHRDRHFRHDMRYVIKRLMGHRPPVRGERIERFYAAPQDIIEADYAFTRFSDDVMTPPRRAGQAVVMRSEGQTAWGSESVQTSRSGPARSPHRSAQTAAHRRRSARKRTIH
jgi:methionyl-tRNA formyltransferase